ncbi:hypothetical protein WJU23_12645 [Prosthecobacter sp. SYSU 5D2]|uniref:hypothetical protein n=1 Tax=Prosthecobacter sp. SYSU 5D2 TaxID=3134134 RepID=UPI0031FEBC83
MSRFQKVPTAPFNPFYGCAIMAMAAFIFFGIIAWSAYSLITQDKEIAKITVDAPITLPPVEVTPEARTALEKRLTTFAEAARNNQPAELSLTIADLNAIISIAPDTGYGSYADLVRLEKTIPDKNAITGQVCLPLNNIKFWEDKKRYLIGEITFYMHIHEEGLDAKVVDVQVPGKEVPDGFVNGMELWPWIAPYRNVEPIGTVLKAVRQVKVTPEGLFVSTRAEP